MFAWMLAASLAHAASPALVRCEVSTEQFAVAGFGTSEDRAKADGQRHLLAMHQLLLAKHLQVGGYDRVRSDPLDAYGPTLQGRWVPTPTFGPCTDLNLNITGGVVAQLGDEQITRGTPELAAHSVRRRACYAEFSDTDRRGYQRSATVPWKKKQAIWRRTHSKAFHALQTCLQTTPTFDAGPTPASAGEAGRTVCKVLREHWANYEPSTYRVVATALGDGLEAAREGALWNGLTERIAMANAGISDARDARPEQKQTLIAMGWVQLHHLARRSDAAESQSLVCNAVPDTAARSWTSGEDTPADCEGIGEPLSGGDDNEACASWSRKDLDGTLPSIQAASLCQLHCIRDARVEDAGEGRYPETDFSDTATVRSLIETAQKTEQFSLLEPLIPAGVTFDQVDYDPSMLGSAIPIELEGRYYLHPCAVYRRARGCPAR